MGSVPQILALSAHFRLKFVGFAPQVGCSTPLTREKFFESPPRGPRSLKNPTPEAIPGAERGAGTLTPAALIAHIPHVAPHPITQGFAPHSPHTNKRKVTPNTCRDSVIESNRRFQSRCIVWVPRVHFVVTSYWVNHAS